MRLPSEDELLFNLRQALVVKAEDLYLAVGGARASLLIENLTGVAEVDDLPSDRFCDDAELAKINVADLAITEHVQGLRAMLEARSLGWGPSSDLLDADAIQQDYLDFVEAFLSALPSIALGGLDWTISARRGSIYDLMLAGQAWQHLTSAIDTGTAGDFTEEPLTPTDLAIIAGIEVRTLRNLVGPTKSIRTIERTVSPKKSGLDSRAFVTVHRVDAIDWLLHRKDFRIASLRPGTLSARLQRLESKAILGRSAVLAGLALGQTLESLADALGTDVAAVRALGDGSGPPALVREVTEYILQLDLARASDTAPATPEG